MSTFRQKYNKRFGFPANASHSKADIAKQTGVPRRLIDKSYDRGVGAWKTNIRSVRLRGTLGKNPNLRKFPRSARLPKEAWGMGRVYSFIWGALGGRSKADPDLQEEARKILKK